MRTRLTIFICVLMGLVSALVLGYSDAQTDDNESCPMFVEQALSQLEDYCGNMERNTACYGYYRVGATFGEEVDENAFRQPSDRAKLASLSSITTAPYDAEAEQWGVAVLNVQANIPNTMPGQAVKFILMGDTEITSAVSPDNLLVTVDPVPITRSVEVNLRSEPGLNANVMATVGVNVELAADGISPDGEWLRVLHNRANMWVSLSVVDEIDVSSLPLIDENTHAPMQAFYFTTGLGNAECRDAPDMLMVQGPDDVLVDLNVNGVNISVGSTVVFRNGQGSVGQILSDPDVSQPIIDQLGASEIDHNEWCRLMQLSVVSGAVELNNGSLILPAGHSADSVVCNVAEQEDTTPVTTEWVNPQPITDENREMLEVLEDVPDDLLNYGIDIPSAEDVENGAKPEIIPDVGNETNIADECLIGEDYSGVRSRIDFDGDGIRNICDRDDDNDGVPDEFDECPLQPGLRLLRGCPSPSVVEDIREQYAECLALLPEDIREACLHDNNGDGTPDEFACPLRLVDRVRDICSPDDNDRDIIDTDGDGLPDEADKCPDEAGPESNYGCPVEGDSDNDGLPDDIDRCPDEAGIGLNGGCPIIDSDGDGVPDDEDACPNDPNDSVHDPCNHDEDGDGILDEEDPCPAIRNDPIGNPCNHDEDGDGVYDWLDACPYIRNDSIGDPCDHDEDGDGVWDWNDACPNNPNDSIGDPCDHDEDNDGVLDWDDACPNDFNDGFRDPCDHDEDGDGVVDDHDACPNNPNDSIGDPCDHDEDGDGVYDWDDACPNDFNDGFRDPCDHDEDGDGVVDDHDACPANPNDGIGDPCNHDEDNDGVWDWNDACPHNPNDGIGDPCNHDEDGDGVYDWNDACPHNPNDGIGDPCNHDEDGDGVYDWNDACPHSFNDGYNDPCNHDEDGDGVVDDHDACPASPNDSVGDPCNHDEDGDGVDDWTDNYPLDSRRQ